MCVLLLLLVVLLLHEDKRRTVPEQFSHTQTRERKDGIDKLHTLHKPNLRRTTIKVDCLTVS
jgi:hypothetical protein